MQVRLQRAAPQLSARHAILEGNAAFTATTRSLQHASAATVRRVTAMGSSHQLSMTVLRWQQQHAHWTMQWQLQYAARQLCARHAIPRWRCCIGSSSMLIGPCMGSYTAPCDSNVLVRPSLDGNAALAAIACSLGHASAATVRRVTAMRSSHHLSMTMLHRQYQHAHCSMQVQL